ncbi:MAG: helix-hairpin-helix domain-containing protein [Gammaproteobacteria bacterium]|nr:helix-hairpin-helix domain-containing protein [Gammaproteobacteria bacterium]
MLRNEISNFQDIPNVGKVIEQQLLLLGITEPSDLIGMNPYDMFANLCRITGKQQDPCIIDVFISAVKYMEGGPIKKWWEFTAERKMKMARNKSSGFL